jgi:uncharacterized protein
VTVPAAPEQPASFHYTALRRLVARHPVAAFLVMAYSVYTAFALPPVRARLDVLPFDLPLWASLGTILGVALPAFIVVAAMHGRAGVRDLARRSLRWRVGVRWYLTALLVVPVAVVLSACAIFGLAPFRALVEKWQLLFTEVVPQLVLLILLFNLAEEVGWTGFLQARLQQRHGPLRASLLVTLPFALWHLPDVMVDAGLGLAKLPLALGLLGILAISQLFGRVVIMWLYNNTRQSVLLVGLFHSTFNVTTGTFGRAFIPVPGGFTLLIAAPVVAVVAVLLVVFTRGRLSYRSDRAPQPAHVAPQEGTPLSRV